MLRLNVMLLTACLLGTSARPAIAQEQSPPPWFGGRAETPDSCTFLVKPAPEGDLDSRAAGMYESLSSDETTTYVEPPEAVELRAGPARLMAYGQRLEEVDDVAREMALYLGEAGTWLSTSRA